MRDRIILILALMALPAVAEATDGERGAVVGTVAAAADAAAEAAAAPSTLDLNVDALPLPAQGAANGARALAPRAPERYAGADPQAAERGLSFGLELRQYRAADNIARVTEPDESGLQDNVERLIDRSAVGLRGKYRF
jgi:hypothetical protein